MLKKTIILYAVVCLGIISLSSFAIGDVQDTHVTSEYGPKITCVAGDLGCHGTYDPPLLADGQDLTNTTVCDNCHSAADAGTAKSYWNNNPGTWVGAEGEEGFCGSCHDVTPGNTDMGGGG